MNHFLGILGGMGPLATADFLRKIVEHTPASNDQEHLPVLLYGDCTTPDRTASIIGEGVSPLPYMLKGVSFLCQAGVGAICIPCNSTHYWYEQIEAASSVPVLHIAKASVAHLQKVNPEARTIGVMSTLGTYRAGIYTEPLLRMGYEVVSPTKEEFDTLVTPGISMVKANRINEAETLFQISANRLLERGAQAIILGCTEIPLGMQQPCHLAPEIYVDSTDALAYSAIDFIKHVK